MKMKALIGLLAASLPAMAVADDLLSLYQEALAADTTYAAARAQLAATEQRVPQAFGARLPSVTLNANASANHQEANTFDQQSYGSNGVSLQLVQPLYRYENEVAYNQSLALVRQARAELEQARQELVLRLTEAYFDALLAQDEVTTLQAERAAIAEQLAAANRGYEIGTASITDVRDAQARYDLVGAQQIVARNNLAASLEQLRVIINRTPQALAPLRTDAPLLGPVPADMEAWVEAAATEGLPVVAAQAALEIARLETRRAMAARYPTLDLTASYGHSQSATINTVGLDLEERVLGVRFSMPLYAGGTLVARQRETASLQEKAGQDLENARRNSMLVARQSFLNSSAGLAQVKALELALISAQTALQSNQRGLELGVRANIDVLNAQQQLSRTELDLARARYDTLLATLRLQAAAGRLGEENIRMLSELFGE